MSEELRNIFEGWAAEKYPNKEGRQYEKDNFSQYLKRTAYTEGCIDFVDVCLRFAHWIDDFENLRQCRKFHNCGSTEELLTNFLRNVYKKQS